MIVVRIARYYKAIDVILDISNIQCLQTVIVVKFLLQNLHPGWPHALPLYNYQIGWDTY